MLVYFAASTSGIPQFEKNYREILKSIISLGLDVADNWFISKLANKKFKKDADEVVKNEVKLVAQADFVLAEIAVPSFGVGYAIKQALTLRKPVLCLYPAEMDHSMASEVLLGNSSNLLKVEFYDSKTLQRILASHLNTNQLYGLTKFNFLISQEISDFLDWATENKQQSKSEFLREAIMSKIVSQDKDYLKVLDDKLNAKKK